MNRSVITTSESDVFLSMYPDWIGLSSSEKTSYISRASVYAQTQWTCEEVDWSDSDLIPTEIKEAVAFYAMADSNGNLFGDVSSTSSDRGKIKRERSRSGSEEEEFEYFGSMPYHTRKSLGYPDTLMEMHCTSSKIGTVTLTRV